MRRHSSRLISTVCGGERQKKQGLFINKIPAVSNASCQSDLKLSMHILEGCCAERDPNPLAAAGQLLIRWTNQNIQICRMILNQDGLLLLRIIPSVHTTSPTLQHKDCTQTAAHHNLLLPTFESTAVPLNAISHLVDLLLLTIIQDDAICNVPLILWKLDHLRHLASKYYKDRRSAAFTPKMCS